MERRGSFSKWTRCATATVLVAAFGVALGTVGTQLVSAASVAPETSFVIDGNREGPNDFAAPYPAGVTPGGFATSGLYYNHQTIDQGGVSGCDLAADDAALGGTKIEDGPIWPINGPNPNGKTDLDFIDVAAEKVAVEDQIFDILYVGYRKCGGNGTWQAVLYLDDGDGLAPTQGDANGDYLFIFDFNPSTGLVTMLQHRMVAGLWTLQTTPSTLISGSAAGDYGEVALNLTGMLILGDGGDRCSTLNVSGQGGAVTGGSLDSALKDLIQVTPLAISNCGALDVSKVSSPAGVTSGDEFHYSVDQGAQADANDIDVVHDASLAVNLNGSGSTSEPDGDTHELDATITAGGTHNWTNVISQPDYTITEDSIPAGWTLDRIECSYTDIFVTPPALKSVVIYQTVNGVGGYTGNELLIPPTTFANNSIAPASCVITNSTSGLVIAKQGSGDPTADFTFPVIDNSDQGASLGSPVLSLNEQSQLIAVPPGHEIQITETSPAGTPSWTQQSVVCSYDAANDDPDLGTIVVWDSATDGPTPTFDSVPGELITCTFTNVQNSRLTLQKAWVGGQQGDQATLTAEITPVTDPATPDDTFVSTVDGASPATETDLDPTPLEFAPGQSIVLAEAIGAGYASLLGCSGGGTLTGDTLATTAADAGSDIVCTFTNTHRGPLEITKTITAGPTRTGVDTYDITYQVSVTSTSHLAETYDVSDTIRFGAGVTVTASSVVGPVGVVVAPGWNGTTNTVLVDDGTIAPLAMQIFTVNVTAHIETTSTATSRDCTLAAGESGTGFLNSALVAYDGGTDTAEVCAPAPAPEVADLAIVKSASVAQIGAGGGFDWTLQVTNNGPGTALDVKVGDLVPAGLTVNGVASSTFDCSLSGNTVACTKASMAAGTSGSITIAVVVPSTAPGATVVNIGTVESSTLDPVLSNNSDDASVVVVAQAPPVTVVPSVNLPATGSNSTGRLAVSAMLLVAMGWVVLAVSRRRHDDRRLGS